MVTTNTLYLKINQGWLYLIENNPDKEKYSSLRKIIEVRRIKSGIHFRWKAPVDSMEEVDYKMIPAKGDFDKSWREQLEDYMETAKENEKFEKRGLGLTVEELDSVRESLVGIEGFHLVRAESDWLMIIHKKENVPT